MPDAFIWYHAADDQEPALQAWMETVEQQADIRGRLLIRRQDEKITFMEHYADVSTPTIDRIERLAAKQPLFESITRCCEAFIDISPLR